MSTVRRLNRGKLGNARKRRMSELERAFLSQQPILQHYYNGRSKQLAEKYAAEGNPCRVTISVIPTYQEKIYNIITEVIPSGAQTQADIFRVTRYIRFKEWLDAQVTQDLEMRKPVEEQDMALLQRLLPDNLSHAFVTVLRKNDRGELDEVQMRQESSVALDWIDNRLKAATELYEQISAAEHTRLSLGQRKAVPTFIRLHYDESESRDVIAVRRLGVAGTPELIQNLGPLLSLRLKKGEKSFEEHTVYEQAEITRFMQRLFDNAFPWRIIDLGLMHKPAHA